MISKKDYNTRIKIVNYNLNSLLLGSFVLALFSGSFYALSGRSLSNSILSFFSACFILCLIIINRKENKQLLIKRSLIIYLDVILLPIAWITTYGSRGPLIYYSVIFIVISSLLSTHSFEKILPLLVVIEVSILWAIESHIKSLINLLSNTYNVAENLLLHYFLASLILCYFMMVNSKNSHDVEAILKDYSIMDPLTKLYNRRYLFERLHALRNEVERTSKRFSLIMIDIDNFKKLNDTYGHIKGDEILEDIGAIIKKCIRSFDIGVRYGGDEFIIVLQEADERYIDAVINRIEKEFLTLAGKYSDVQLGFSYGYSNNNSLSDEKIIQEADSNLYSHKISKKTRI